MIAAITAAACALPGVFLVLRRMTMMSDAISHTVLLGIVIGFFLVQDLTSPLLVLGAAAVGVLTVSLVALLERTRLVKEDAAIGLVFPALFSIAVIMITRFAGNVHLDTDAVLLGEIAFAPFDRFEAFGADLGPRGMWVMGGILLINLALHRPVLQRAKTVDLRCRPGRNAGLCPGRAALCLDVAGLGHRGWRI
jgi:manganese/zinc/iron transport system permease protein